MKGNFTKITTFMHGIITFMQLPFVEETFNMLRKPISGLTMYTVLIPVSKHNILTEDGITARINWARHLPLHSEKVLFS